jgi:hypothetical protein
MTKSTAPITVGWYLNPVEAQIAKSRLESEDIPAFLHSVNHSSMVWPITLALGGIQLQVPPSAVSRAKKILDIDEQDKAEEVVPCPGCGSEDKRTYEASWRLSMVSSHIAGIPLPFRRKRRHCESRGNTWKSY